MSTLYFYLSFSLPHPLWPACLLCLSCYTTHTVDPAAAASDPVSPLLESPHHHHHQQDHLSCSLRDPPGPPPPTANISLAGMAALDPTGASTMGTTGHVPVSEVLPMEVPHTGAPPLPMPPQHSSQLGLALGQDPMGHSPPSLNMPQAGPMAQQLMHHSPPQQGGPLGPGAMQGALGGPLKCPPGSISNMKGESSK